MSVYVDDSAWPYRGQLYCHMIADTTEELNAMADAIGLKRSWLQDAGTWKEHYDLAPSRRARAVRNGAIEITGRELGRMLTRRLEASRQDVTR